MTLLKPQNHKYILVVIRHKYRSFFTYKLYENKLISKNIICPGSIILDIGKKSEETSYTYQLFYTSQIVDQGKQKFYNLKCIPELCSYTSVASIFFFTLGQIRLQYLRNSTSIALSVSFSFSLQTVREGKQKLDHDDSFSF